MKRTTVFFLICVFVYSIPSVFAQKPNVLLIVTDQHSGVITSQYGYPYITTPGIDKIASQGVAFTRSYTTYPVCMSMRATLITGVMASKSSPSLSSYTSIGTKAEEAGYATAYYGKWHVGHSKMDKTEDWHGFEKYSDMRQDTDIKNKSVDYLKQEHDKPFFMVTSFLNPHNCCELARSMSGLKKKVKYTDGAVEENMDIDQCPPLPANFAIPEGEAEGFSCRRWPDTTNLTQYGKHPVKYWDENRWRQYMYGYDQLVEKVDAHVLDMMNTLEAQGLLENTIVIYTSDHGDGHASHQWNQKMTFYEESVNVPFVVSWKGQTRAGVIDRETLISNALDLYPTLCKVMGVEYGDEIFGEDILPQTLAHNKKKTLKRDYVVSEINQNTTKKGEKVTFVGRMIVTEDYKYILFDGGENREQFFDLKKDAGEMVNESANSKYKKEVKMHRAMLKEWIERTDDEFSTTNIPSV